MTAQDRRLLENGDVVRPVQQMSGHEPGTAATDDCNLQAVILWLLVSSKLPWRGRCSIQELQEDAGAEFVGNDCA
jgi:hypothetical protein